MNTLPFINKHAPALATAPGAATASAAFSDEQNETPAILVYLNILRRRKWLIAGVVVVALLVGLAVTLLSTSMYIATSRIEIQRENYNIVRVQGVEPETNSVDLEFYQTEYGLLQADSLAERVATDLKLYDDPAFFSMFGNSAARSWFENGRPRPGASTREQRIQVAGAILGKHITIAPIRLSRLIDVSFSSPDPAFSARVVDAWTRLFISTTLERRMEATSYARRFLETRLAQLKTRLDESEQSLVRYAEAQGIVNLPAASAGSGASAPERSIVADDLSSLNTALTEAISDRVRAQSNLAAGGSSSADTTVDPVIAGLRQRRAELSSEYAKMMVQFDAGYPPAVALRDQISSLDKTIGREEGRTKGTLRTAYEASVGRENRLQSRVDQLKTNLLDLRRRSIQYNIFQRDVDTNRQLYDALLQRYKEIGVAGGVGVNNISIVDPAKIPMGPSSPRPFVNLLIALVAGLVLGGAVALVMEHLDDAVSDPAEMQRKLNLAAVGIIPDLKPEDMVESLADRKSNLSEAYLAAQTSLGFSTDHGFPKTLIVTSSAPGEGKSTTAFALALSLFRTGRRVVLVDGDMRSPSLHFVVGTGNEHGLSNFLAGEDSVDHLIHHDPSSGLSVILAGPQPPNAAELLSGGRLPLLLERLLEKFDHVIVDAPPVMGLADSPLMGHQMEGAVFVVRAQSTRVSAARLALNRLTSSQTRVIGAILTRYDAKKAYYGYGYDYGHGYGYGKTVEGSR